MISQRNDRAASISTISRNDSYLTSTHMYRPIRMVFRGILQRNMQQWVYGSTVAVVSCTFATVQSIRYKSRRLKSISITYGVQRISWILPIHMHHDRRDRKQSCTSFHHRGSLGVSVPSGSGAGAGTAWATRWRKLYGTRFCLLQR